MKWAGHTFLLKMLVGGEYITLAGQRDTSLSRQLQLIDTSDKDSRWRQLMVGAILQDTITARGLLQDAESHRLLTALANTGEFHEFQLVYADGFTTAGRYQVSAWSGEGDFKPGQQYKLTLNRAEEIPMKQLRCATFVNGGQVLTNAANAVDIPMVVDAQIVGVILLAQESAGNCVVDIRKSTYAAFPPGAGDSICGDTKPTIDNDIKAQDLSLAGWNVSLVAGDVLRFKLLSVGVFTVLECWLILEINE